MEIYFSPAPIDFRLIEPGELLFAIGWGAVRGNAQMVSNIVTHELRSSILCIENQVTCSHAFLGVQYNYDFITCGVTTDLLGEITNVSNLINIITYIFLFLILHIEIGMIVRNGHFIYFTGRLWRSFDKYGRMCNWNRCFFINGPWKWIFIFSKIF